MKKLLLSLLILGSSSIIFAQQLVLRTNLLSNLRHFPTANLNIGIITKSKKLEAYLSLEKAYASKEEIIKGSFQPDNSKLNMELGIGSRIYLMKKNKVNFIVFGEFENANLNFLYKKVSTFYDKTDGFPTTFYATDGIIYVTRYKFNRIQILAGIGLQLAITKKVGINFTIAKLKSYHKSIEISNEPNEIGGQKLIQKAIELNNSIFRGISFSDLFNSDDRKIISENKSTNGIQPGLSIYYTFGK